MPLAKFCRQIVVGGCFLVGATVALAETSALEPAPWSQFRGPAGDGVADAGFDLTLVGNSDRLAWRTEIPGVGWSSPVTDGGRIFLTSSIATKASAEQKRRALAGKQFASIKDVAGSVELLAFCLDTESGEIVWQRSLATIDSPSPIHPMNSYASPTPVVADDRVIFHFGGYGTWAVHTGDGETIWQQRLVVDDSVGPGSSPARYRDQLIIPCDGIDRQFVASLSIETGEVVWQTPRPPMRSNNGEFQKAYSTPTLINVDSRPQAIVPAAQWLVAYDPANGEEIWRADCDDGFSNATMAIPVGDVVVFSTGFSTPELVAVDPRGRGDVTASHIRWRQSRGAPSKPSLATDGRGLYTITDNGILHAIDPATGQLRWRQRLGGTYSASPLVAGETAMIADHDGKVTVFGLGDQYRGISSVEMGEQIMASPLPIDGDIVLRTRAALYRYRTSPSSP